MTNTRKYITEIGIEIEKQKIEIDVCLRSYDIATEFGHQFTGSQNDDKWKLYGAPLRVMETIAKQTAILEK